MSLVPLSPSRARFSDAVRNDPVELGLACLLVGCEVDPDLDVDLALTAVDALAATARPFVPPDCAPAVAAEGLRRALGDQAGFAGGDFEDLRSSLLHEVLRRGTGLPLLLSVVWLEVAGRLGVPAYAVGLPGQVVVRIGRPRKEHVLVDPYAGGGLLPPDRLVGPNGAPLRPQDLAPIPAVDLVLRLLTNVRALTARQPPSLAGAVTRLWAVDLSLLLPRHPVALRRERGELLVRLGDHVGGAKELETYALVVGNFEERKSARRAAGLARAQLN